MYQFFNNRPSQISLILVMVGCFISSCNHKPEDIRQLVKEEEEMGVEVANDIAITYADSGMVKAIITAPLMERYHNKSNPYLEMKKGLKAEFFSANKEVESTLTALYGISYDNSKLIHLKNKVKVINREKEELESEELLWDQNTQKVYTTKFVTIKRKNEIIYGDGFESNETFSKYRILRPKGRVNIKSENQ